MERGLGAVVERVEPGAVTLGCDLLPGRLDRHGQPIMAVLSCLADCAIGVSVFSAFSTPTGGSTVEMRVDRSAPLGPGAAALRVDGVLSHRVASSGVGRAVLTDDTGVVVAHAMATMAVVGAKASAGGASDPGGGLFEAPSSPAVRFDPVALDGLSVWDSRDPLTANVPLDETMSNPRRQVHGGVLLAIAERAQRRVHPDGASTLSASIEYIRPVPIAVETVECRSTVVRQGRRFSTVRTDFVRPDGKLAAVATSIAMVAPAEA
ncbi:PaaI family thioesterase [Acidiferrimicrobium sp. IK]|nr:PaaI family thioesterase [Acidiferrimicrobium sp. IK]